MKQSFGNLFILRIRITETENIGIENRPRRLSRSHNIAIDADDTGDGAAVRIESRRRVVSLDLKTNQMIFIKFDNPRIIGKNRTQKRLFRRQQIGRFFDIFFKKRVNFFGFSVFRIKDIRVENLVFAVFAPRLGNHFEFNVSRLRRQTVLLPPFPNIAAAVIAAHRFHLVKRKRQKPFGRKLLQTVVRKRIDFNHRRFGRTDRHFVRIELRKTRSGGKLVRRQNRRPFN